MRPALGFRRTIKRVGKEGELGRWGSREGASREGASREVASWEKGKSGRSESQEGDTGKDES